VHNDTQHAVQQEERNGEGESWVADAIPHENQGHHMKQP
jgi:hypothetical protein